MNRRHKKKQKVDHVAVLKNIVQRIDWRSKVEPLKHVWLSLPKVHRRILTVLIPLFILALIIPAPKENVLETRNITEPQRVAIALDNQGLSEVREEGSADSIKWQSYTVKNGDTLAQVFRANKLPMMDLNALVNIEGSDKPLSRIKQGQIVRFKLSNQGGLDILQLEKEGKSVMFFRLSDGGFGRSK